MGALLRKSPLYPELTQMMDLEETEKYSYLVLQMKVFSHKKFLKTHFLPHARNFKYFAASFEVL